MHDRNICAIIVTYRYPYEKLHQLISSINGKVDHVCLIDNNDSKKINHGSDKIQKHNCTVIVNGVNLGLAAAINQGIRFAIERHFRYVILFDQDSRPEPGMIEQLISARHLLVKRGEKVAAIGPVIVDQRQIRPLPFLLFKKTHFKKIRSLNDETFIPVDFLISSGSLFDVEILITEGMMDESLFVDNVDLEWCFRVKKAGYRLYGIRNAILHHQIGEGVIKLPFTDKFVLLHQPERQYYIMRNRIFLYRRHYIPLSWKLQDFLRLLFKLFFFSVGVRPRFVNARMMVKGILDGVSGKI